MLADQEVDLRLAGTNPGTGGLAVYQAVHARARNLWGTIDQNAPFQINFGQGPVPVAIATYDQITCTAEATTWRHVDPYGSVANMMKVNLLLWYWLMDGCPTNMGSLGSPTNRVPQYEKWAGVMRDWPTGYPGAMPGEPQANYPAFPPALPTTLDSVAGTNVSTVLPVDPRTHPVAQRGWDDPVQPNPVCAEAHSLLQSYEPHYDHRHHVHVRGGLINQPGIVDDDNFRVKAEPNWEPPLFGKAPISSDTALARFTQAWGEIKSVLLELGIL